MSACMHLDCNKEREFLRKRATEAAAEVARLRAALDESLSTLIKIGTATEFPRQHADGVTFETIKKMARDGHMAARAALAESPAKKEGT